MSGLSFRTRSLPSQLQVQNLLRKEFMCRGGSPLNPALRGCLSTSVQGEKFVGRGCAFHDGFAFPIGEGSAVEGRTLQCADLRSNLCGRCGAGPTSGALQA